MNKKIEIEIEGKSYTINLESGIISRYVFSRGCDESGDIEGWEHVGSVIKSEGL